MRRILVITNNLQQASFRVRIEALVSAMRERGFDWHIEVRPRSLLARRALLRSANDYDAVILQRKLLDPMDARILRRHAKSLFFDVDDAIMFHARPVGAISRWRTRRRFIATARAVDHVVAGNRYLADLFASEGATTSVIPTVVDPARYRVKTHESRDVVSLVWIGSRSTIGYVRDILPTLRRAAALVGNLKLLTIADASVEASSELPVEHIPWSAETEVESLLRGDIGIAPTPRDPWTLGKCGFKIVQCMSAGLPVIASPVGANAEIIVNGTTGFHANTAEQWIAAIEQLARDASLRATMGGASRARIESHYSLSRAADEWARQLSRQILVPSPPGRGLGLE